MTVIRRGIILDCGLIQDLAAEVWTIDEFFHQLDKMIEDSVHATAEASGVYRFEWNWPER